MPTAAEPIKSTTYDRPRSATLIVRTEDGDEWPATTADLEKFKLIDRMAAYSRFTKMFCEGLGIESDRQYSEAANAVRYVVECVLMYDHSPWAKADGEPWGDEDAIDGDETVRLLRAALGHTPAE